MHILEHSLSVFAIFVCCSLSDPVLERSLSIFTILLRIFMQIFAFFNEFDGFCMIRRNFDMVLTRSLSVFAIFAVQFR